MTGGVYQYIAWEKPLWLAALVVVAALAYFSRRSLVRFSPAQRMASLAVRLLLVLALLAALADPRAVYKVDDRFLVVAIDGSHSITAPAQHKIDQYLDVIQTARQAQKCRVAYTTFAGRLATWPMAVRKDALQPDQSNLAAAIRMLAGLHGDCVWEGVLLSDGNENTGDARAAAAACRTPITVVPLPGLPDDEVYVESVRVAGPLRLRETARADVALWSRHAERGRVRIRCGDELAAERAVELMEGSNHVPISFPATAAGWHVVTAEIEGFRDTLPGNNYASTTMFVSPPQQVRIVSADDAAAAPLAALLAPVLPPAAVVVRQNVTQLPGRAEDLAAVDLLLLANVPAADLTPGQVDALERAVSKQGMGLIVTGGERSFFAGGYAGGRLEQLLPVASVDKPKPHTQGLALALVIDCSGSMEGPRIAMAKEAARQAVRMLGPDDQLGVLEFEYGSSWVVPIAAVDDKPRVIARIEQLKADGATNMYPAVEKAFLALRDAYAQRRHIIVLTDGIARMADFAALARRIAAAGITISTVAVGHEAAGPGLAEIAALGHGRYYACDDPKSVPQVFALETAGAARQGISEGAFFPQPTRAQMAAAWLPQGEAGKLPALLGYDEARPKPRSRVLLEAGGDPIVATWQFGSGNVTAVLTDLHSPWTAAWGNWAGRERLLGALTAAAVRPPQPTNTAPPPLPPDYPAELRVAPTNTALLHAIATATLGRYDPRPEELLAPTSRGVLRDRPLWRYLALAAAVLLVIDVLLRRIGLTAPAMQHPAPVDEADDF